MPVDVYTHATYWAIGVIIAYILFVTLTFSAFAAISFDGE